MREGTMPFQKTLPGTAATTACFAITTLLMVIIDINKWYVLSSISSTIGTRPNCRTQNTKYKHYPLANAAACTPPIVVSKGLRNLGNTCYMNAQLQCSFHIPKIRDLLILGEKDTREDNESPGFNGLRSVFHGMFQQALQDETNLSGGCISAHTLCRLLGINPMEQQDTQEFWKLLLPQLPQPIIDTYTGSYEDYIIACDGTGRLRRKEIPFVDLSLEVPTTTSKEEDDDMETSETSLMQSFRSMFQTPELLSVAEGNGWRPPPPINTNSSTKNNEKVDALKGQLLHRQGLPSLLQLHLKRFQYDWQSHTITKLNNRYTFPEEIDLSEIIASNNDTISTPHDETPSSTQYVLQSVIVHAGPFGSGHYYTYCKPMLPYEEYEEENSNTTASTSNTKMTNKINNTKSCQWYRFDDEIVTPVTFEEVLTDAYGGICIRDKEINEKQLRNTSTRRNKLFQWLTSTTLPFTSKKYTHGYGGRDSCAYVLQYVRKRDIPFLYNNT